MAVRQISSANKTMRLRNSGKKEVASGSSNDDDGGRNVRGRVATAATPVEKGSAIANRRRKDASERHHHHRRRRRRPQDAKNDNEGRERDGVRELCDVLRARCEDGAVASSKKDSYRPRSSNGEKARDDRGGRRQRVVREEPTESKGSPKRKENVPKIVNLQAESTEPVVDSYPRAQKQEKKKAEPHVEGGMWRERRRRTADPTEARGGGGLDPPSSAALRRDRRAAMRRTRSAPKANASPPSFESRDDRPSKSRASRDALRSKTVGGSSTYPRTQESDGAKDADQLVSTLRSMNREKEDTIQRLEGLLAEMKSENEQAAKDDKAPHRGKKHSEPTENLCRDREAVRGSPSSCPDIHRVVDGSTTARGGLDTRAHLDASDGNDGSPSTEEAKVGHRECYQPGQTLLSRAHALAFTTDFQASVILNQMSPGSPLFVKRTNREWTCCVTLADGRSSSSVLGGSLAVALDEEGRIRKVLEKDKWKKCLRLVNRDVVDAVSMSDAGTTKTGNDKSAGKQAAATTMPDDKPPAVASSPELVRMLSKSASFQYGGPATAMTSAKNTIGTDETSELSPDTVTFTSVNLHARQCTRRRDRMRPIPRKIPRPVSLDSLAGGKVIGPSGSPNEGGSLWSSWSSFDLSSRSSLNYDASCGGGSDDVCVEKSGDSAAWDPACGGASRMRLRGVDP